METSNTPQTGSVSAMDAAGVQEAANTLNAFSLVDENLGIATQIEELLRRVLVSVASGYETGENPPDPAVDPPRTLLSDLGNLRGTLGNIRGLVDGLSRELGVTSPS